MRSGPSAAASPSQSGAAILSALLLMTLVASLAIGTLWQQWKVTEVERHERNRQQAQWILHGAIDWARVILVEDGRGSRHDHLDEPWALPLQEARLSSFLAADGNTEATHFLGQVFLSGRIEDMQGRLNLRNLLHRDDLSRPDIEIAERLFALLDLPTPLVQELAQRLHQAHKESSKEKSAEDRASSFLPQRTEQLVWLGLSEQQVARLAPHVTLLPERTPLNLNTASAELLHAAVGQLSLGDARSLVQRRERQAWRDMVQARNAFGPLAGLNPEQHSVNSRYFRITGLLRLDDLQFSQQALMQRDGLRVRVLWRQNQVNSLETQNRN